MWSFWENTKVRQAKVKEFRRKLFLESLEDRSLLAGNIIAILDGAGNLILTEDPATPATDNAVNITFTLDNVVTVAGAVGTSVNNVAGPGPLVFPVTGSIIASFGGGNDDLQVFGNFFDLTGGGITYDGGVGQNDFVVTQLTLGTAALKRDLTVSNAGNAAPVSVNQTNINDLSARSILVANGLNNSTSTLIIESDTTGNVTIANSGGAGTTHSVNVDPTLVGGNLLISNAGPSASYAVTVDDTTVGGNLTIVNGDSTGAAGSVIFIGQTAGFSLGASVGGNLVAQNGTVSAPGADNSILISQTSITGSATLVNGNTAHQATIRLGDFGPAPVSVGGSFTATNGTSGNNSINLDRISVAAGNNTTLTNGNAVGSDNQIHIGTAGGGIANLGGGLTAINGNAADDNRIHVFFGTIGTAGGLAANNAVLQNGNVGLGESSDIVIGEFANVNLPNGGLTIIDGNGNARVNLIRADLSNPAKGNLLISTAGGNDTVNIAPLAGVTVRVRGGTTVVTGDGADALNIATPNATLAAGGFAALDRIFASLGTGDDELNIGANANGTPDANAFDSLAGFFFDGGEGGETLLGDRARVATAVLGPGILTGPASTRFFNFESLVFVP